jgi:hypothetical protein
MPSMPIYFVGKGRQFGLLDQQFGVPNYLAAYRAVLQEIDDPLADLADQHAAGQPGPGRAGLTSGDARHFREHWLDGGANAWWPGKHAEEVLRAGYKAAIEHAERVKKPIESLWVCADEGEFQLYFSESPQQVTVIVFTPPPPGEGANREHSRDPLPEEEPIWVVKVKEKDDDDYNRGSRDYQVVDPANDIIVRRVRYEAPTGGSMKPTPRP